MKLFNEWMSFRSSTAQPINSWIFVSKEGLVEARKTLEAKAGNLFRTFAIKEERHEQGQSVISISGDPLATLFELEENDITPDVC